MHRTRTTTAPIRPVPTRIGLGAVLPAVLVVVAVVAARVRHAP